MTHFKDTIIGMYKLGNAVAEIADYLGIEDADTEEVLKEEGLM